MAKICFLSKRAFLSAIMISLIALSTACGGGGGGGGGVSDEPSTNSDGSDTSSTSTVEMSLTAISATETFSWIDPSGIDHLEVTCSNGSTVVSTDTVSPGTGTLTVSSLTAENLYSFSVVGVDSESNET